LSRKGAHVKHETLEQTARYWVGQDKQGRYMCKVAGKRFTLGHAEHIHEVLQEDSRSNIYKVYDSVTYAKKKKETEML
jgi:hypothetical protein